MRNLMNKLVTNVLNAECVRSRAYRSLNIPKMIGLIGRVRINLMIIGRDNCWLVNTKTSHREHFVGTKHTFDSTDSDTSVRSQGKLRNLALRYASPGATVEVYILRGQADMIKPVAVFQKSNDALFQAPGCSHANSNGIRLPNFITHPI